MSAVLNLMYVQTQACSAKTRDAYNAPINTEARFQPLEKLSKAAKVTALAAATVFLAVLETAFCWATVPTRAFIESRQAKAIELKNKAAEAVGEIARNLKEERDIAEEAQRMQAPENKSFVQRTTDVARNLLTKEILAYAAGFGAFALTWATKG